MCIQIPGAVTPSRHNYGQGSGQIFLNNVGCNGNESSLIECSHSISHVCSHNSAIAVQCSTSKIKATSKF